MQRRVGKLKQVGAIWLVFTYISVTEINILLKVTQVCNSGFFWGGEGSGIQIEGIFCF